MKRKAFTLVELIVVITILAILGTIAFISLQGYSKDARDSTRLSDINNMKKALELYVLDTNKYPFPDESYKITYSGTPVWTQGTFGSGVLKTIQKLSNIPLDPLTNNQYTYSVLNTQKEYQIGGVIEGELSMKKTGNTIPGLQEVNADGETLATAYVTGNYNGLAAKTLSGTNCSILSIPSIITSTGTTIGETINIENILTSKSLVYKGKNNLPFNTVRNSKLKLDGGFDFDNSADLIAYSDSNECNTLATDSNARLDLYNGLKNSYSGTIVQNEQEVYSLINSTDTDKIISNIVSNSLGSKMSFKDNLNNILAKSCREILDNDSSKLNQDDIYTIYPNGEAIEVFCDMTTDGGGWTLLGTLTKDFLPTAYIADWNSYPDVTPNNPTISGIYKGGLSIFTEVKEQVSCDNSGCKNVYGKGLNLTQLNDIRKTWAYLDGGSVTTNRPNCRLNYNDAIDNIINCGLISSIETTSGWQRDANGSSCWAARGNYKSTLKGSSLCSGEPNGTKWSLLWFR